MAGESIRFNASLNTAEFNSGAARLQQIAAATSGKVSASFASMGAKIAAVIAPFVGLYAAINSVKNALDLGGRLNDLSKTTGETAGNLAILERAFQNAGVGGERMGMAIASMSNFITDFKKGSKSASETMDLLGISIADLAGKSPIEQMKVFMSAIAGIRDPALRTALAMDVFKKAGKEIVPLAQNFSGELSNAKSELGSLPRILNENAASLDDLGDKLQNAVGSKLTELAVGFVAGASGADKLASSLANIDAAGLGENIGNQLRSAFAAPLEYVQAIGEFLISGFLEAGNRLQSAMQYAVDTYYNMMMNPTFWNGFKTYVGALFASLGSVFVESIIPLIKAALSAMDWNPLWRPFSSIAKGQLDELQQRVSETGDAIKVNMAQGALEMTAAYNGGRKDAQYIYQDSLGAAEHYKQGLQHLENASNEAKKIAQSAKQTSDNLASNDPNEALRAQNGLLEENAKKLRQSIEAEIEHAEAMAFGTDEAKSKAEWMKIYNEQLARGATEDQARRAANAGTYKEPKQSATSTGGGSIGSSQAAQATTEERIAAMRGEARGAAASAAAQRFQNAGQFRSAVRAQDRAQRQMEKAMEKARVKDFLKSEYGTTNMGEAYQKYKENKGRKLQGRMSEKDFAEDIKKSARTPEERMRAEEEAKKKSGKEGKEGGKPSDPMQTVTDIYQLLTERLPIHVLAA